MPAMRLGLALLMAVAGFGALWLTPSARSPEPSAEALGAVASGTSVVFYSRPSCGWCRRTEAWLDAQEIAYQKRDVDTDPAVRRELQRLTGRARVPVVRIGGEWVQGFAPARLREILARRDSSAR